MFLSIAFHPTQGQMSLCLSSQIVTEWRILDHTIVADVTFVTCLMLQIPGGDSLH